MEAGRATHECRSHAERRRSARVLALIVAITLMSLGDLYMTMVHLRGFGMLEMNPIARLVMRYHAPWVLVLWKVATVLLGAGILARFRCRRSAELAAILCCSVMTALTIQWIRYSDQVSHNSALMQSVATASADSPDFVRSGGQ
jgi:hypothetical protein